MKPATDATPPFNLPGLALSGFAPKNENLGELNMTVAAQGLRVKATEFSEVLIAGAIACAVLLAPRK